MAWGQREYRDHIEVSLEPPNDPAPVQHEGNLAQPAPVQQPGLTSETTEPREQLAPVPNSLFPPWLWPLGTISTPRELDTNSAPPVTDNSTRVALTPPDRGTDNSTPPPRPFFAIPMPSLGTKPKNTQKVTEKSLPEVPPPRHPFALPIPLPNRKSPVTETAPKKSDKGLPTVPPPLLPLAIPIPGAVARKKSFQAKRSVPATPARLSRRSKGLSPENQGLTYQKKRGKTLKYNDHDTINESGKVHGNPDEPKPKINPFPFFR
jgi:hypothetical protein